MPVKPIPDGWHTLTPFLILDDAKAALDFYQRAFGAEEISVHDGPGGKIMHAEMRIGNSMFMLADEFPEMGAKSAASLGGCPIGLHLYVEDSDAAFKRAVDAGAKVERELQNQFYGDRSGTVRDPYGYQWTVSTHIEDVDAEEMARREKAQYGGG